MAGRLRQELLDPWGGVIAGVAGGLAWAVAPLGAAALPVGLGVAAVVYGVKVGAGLLTRERDADRPAAEPDPQLRPPRRGSIAEQWLTRAERADRSLAELVRSPGSAVAKQQLVPVREGAAEALATMRRLAGQVTAVEDAADRIEPARLTAERDRLAAAVADASSDRVRAERTRSLASVSDQLQVAQRLAGARDELLARMQATALSLEGLVARTAELLAMSVSGGVDASADRLAEYTEVLRRNCECRVIDEICLFREGDGEPTVACSKVRMKRASHRPLYSDYFSWINESAGPDDVSIIANADIYFDEQLELFRNWSLPPNVAFMLAPWDVDETGRSAVRYRNNSQDTWIFRGRVRAIAADFPAGVPRCDNRLAYELTNAGFRVLNPAFSIRAHHLHSGPRKSYRAQEHTDLIPPPYGYQWPHNLWSLPRTAAYNSRHPSAPLGWRIDRKWYEPRMIWAATLFRSIFRRRPTK